MRERGRGARAALGVVLAVVAVLVIINGIILLCETDPKQFYANLFGWAQTASSTMNP